MKKGSSVICAVIAFIFIFASAVPAYALGDGKTFEKRNITTYIYGMDNSTALQCLFDTELQEVPYINVLDYLSFTYIISYNFSYKGFGKYSVSGDSGTMTVDTVNDTVYFNSYETFLLYGVYYEGSSLDSDYTGSSEAFYYNSIKPLFLDLSKYGIDVISYEGGVYFPVSVLNDIFVLSYNAAEYIDGALYFLHTMDDSVDGYFDRSPVYNNLQRSEKMTEFTYNELCFQIDHFYGAPSKAEIADSIVEKGFDKTLDEYSEETRAAKALLKSTDLVDFYLGLCALAGVFYDGGHTVLYYDPVTAAQIYPKTAFGKNWNMKYQLSNEAKWKAARDARQVATVSSLKDQNIKNTKNLQYKKYSVTKEWSGVAKLVICKNTAVFSFDSFDNEVIEPFKWSLDYASEQGVKNFLIDITTNKGGSTGVLSYIMAMLTNKNTGSAAASSGALFTVTGNIFLTKTKTDLNLDGKVDDTDKEFYYDFDYAILTSRSSFSCGNLLPVLAKENGIMIIGETSGGGTCSISKLYTPGSGFYYMSNFYKFIDKEGNDADSGAPVDYDLTKKYANSLDLTQYGIDDPDAMGFFSYDDFYDFELIGELIDDFYTRGDVNGDRELNNKDVALLFRYVSEYLNAEYKRVYDFNKDGIVNNKDVTLMFRAVSTA